MILSCSIVLGQGLACGERLPDSQTLSMISALRTVRAIGLPGSRKYAACAKASSNTPPAHVKVVSDLHLICACRPQA